MAGIGVGAKGVQAVGRSGTSYGRSRRQDPIPLWQDYRVGCGGALVGFLGYPATDTGVLGVSAGRLCALGQRSRPACCRRPGPQQRITLAERCAPFPAGYQMLG